MVSDTLKRVKNVLKRVSSEDTTYEFEYVVPTNHASYYTCYEYFMRTTYIRVRVRNALIRRLWLRLIYVHDLDNQVLQRQQQQHIDLYFTTHSYSRIPYITICSCYWFIGNCPKKLLYSLSLIFCSSIET